MSQELTTIAPEVAQLLPILPTPNAKYWLQIGIGQLKLSESLTAIEQRFSVGIVKLARIDGEADAAYQQRLAAGLPELKKIADEAVNTRKGYTTHLDAAKDACMKVEKLLAASPEWTALTAKELELRKAMAAEAESVAALEREKTAFRLHFVNEFDRITADLRGRLAGFVSTAYKQALETKMPVEGIPGWIKEHEAGIGKLLPVGPNPFARKLLNDADAMTIYNSIAKVPVAAIQKEAIESLHEKFSTYTSDLANVDAAIQHEVVTFEATVIEAAKEVEQQAAVNTLLATSQSFAIPEGPTVKVKESIDARGLTIPEATAIQAAFLLHGERAWGKVRSAPEKLTVAQQAAALDAIEVRVIGVRYIRWEK